MLFGRKKEKEKEPWRDGVYLTTVQTTWEAEMLESRLRAEEIPSIRRYEGSGNYLEIVFGQQTVYPIEIYVPEAALEKAKELLKVVPIEDDFEEATEADEEGCSENNDAGEAVTPPGAEAEPEHETEAAGEIHE